jgi:hypothetical protein
MLRTIGFAPIIGIVLLIGAAGWTIGGAIVSDNSTTKKTTSILSTAAHAAQMETVEQMCSRETSREHKVYGDRCVEKVNELNAQGKAYADAHPKPKEPTDDERHHMTDLERSRDPLYGLTRNEFSGCQQLKLALYGLPIDGNGNIYSSGWSPFECYKLQWQSHKDAKACYSAAISTYQQNAASYDVPAKVRKDLEDDCAMLMESAEASGAGQ